MISKGEAINRIRYMLIEAAVLLILFLVLGYPIAALGLGAGTGVGIFNYWLVTKVVLDESAGNETSTQSSLMKRYLLRFVIGGAVIILTALIDTRFLLGAILGLTLEMQTYLWEAFGQIIRKPS